MANRRRKKKRKAAKKGAAILGVQWKEGGPPVEDDASSTAVRLPKFSPMEARVYKEEGREYVLISLSKYFDGSLQRTTLGENLSMVRQKSRSSGVRFYLEHQFPSFDSVQVGTKYYEVEKGGKKVGVVLIWKQDDETALYYVIDRNRAPTKKHFFSAEYLPELLNVITRRVQNQYDIADSRHRQSLKFSLAKFLIHLSAVEFKDPKDFFAKIKVLGGDVDGLFPRLIRAGFWKSLQGGGAAPIPPEVSFATIYSTIFFDFPELGTPEVLSAMFETFVPDIQLVEDRHTALYQATCSFVLFFKIRNTNLKDGETAMSTTALLKRLIAMCKTMLVDYFVDPIEFVVDFACSLKLLVEDCRDIADALLREVRKYHPDIYLSDSGSSLSSSFGSFFSAHNCSYSGNYLSVSDGGKSASRLAASSSDNGININDAKTKIRNIMQDILNEYKAIAKLSARKLSDFSVLDNLFICLEILKNNFHSGLLLNVVNSFYQAEVSSSFFSDDRAAKKQFAKFSQFEKYIVSQFEKLIEQRKSEAEQRAERKSKAKLQTIKTRRVFTPEQNEKTKVLAKAFLDELQRIEIVDLSTLREMNATFKSDGLRHFFESIDVGDLNIELLYSCLAHRCPLFSNEKEAITILGITYREALNKRFSTFGSKQGKNGKGRKGKTVSMLAFKRGAGKKKNRGANAGSAASSAGGEGVSVNPPVKRLQRKRLGDGVSTANSSIGTPAVKPPPQLSNRQLIGIIANEVKQLLNDHDKSFGRDRLKQCCLNIQLDEASLALLTTALMPFEFDRVLTGCKNGNDVYTTIKTWLKLKNRQAKEVAFLIRRRIIFDCATQVNQIVINVCGFYFSSYTSEQFKVWVDKAVRYIQGRLEKNEVDPWDIYPHLSEVLEIDTHADNLMNQLAPRLCQLFMERESLRQQARAQAEAQTQAYIYTMEQARLYIVHMQAQAQAQVAYMMQAQAAVQEQVQVPEEDQKRKMLIEQLKESCTKCMVEINSMLLLQIDDDHKSADMVFAKFREIKGVVEMLRLIMTDTMRENFFSDLYTRISRFVWLNDRTKQLLPDFIGVLYRLSSVEAVRLHSVKDYFQQIFLCKSEDEVDVLFSRCENLRPCFLAWLKEQLIDAKSDPVGQIKIKALLSSNLLASSKHLRDECVSSLGDEEGRVLDFIMTIDFKGVSTIWAGDHRTVLLPGGASAPFPS